MEAHVSISETVYEVRNSQGPLLLLLHPSHRFLGVVTLKHLWRTYEMARAHSLENEPFAMLLSGKFPLTASFS